MTKIELPQLEEFIEQDETGVLYTPSLQVVLYAKKPLPELAMGAIACYRQFMDKFGDSLYWYTSGSLPNVKRFSDKEVEYFPNLCTEPHPEVPAWDIRMPAYQVFNGSGVMDFIPPIFDTGGYGYFSWLQYHLPLTVAEDTQELFTLLTQTAEQFPFRCGHVGLSLCWNELSMDRDGQVPPLIRPLLKRYPGFSLGTPAELCDQELPPVNWLTLIGPEMLGRLGGVDRVDQDLSDGEISVNSMGLGACIRAGETPQIGDVNRQDDLPVYRKVGAYLKDYRGQRDIQLRGLSKDESAEWLARFDE